MLAAVLPDVEDGPAVLATIRAAKDSIDRAKPKVRAALETIARHFEIDLKPPSIQALLDFTAMWENKAFTETGEPGEFSTTSTTFLKQEAACLWHRGTTILFAS